MPALLLTAGLAGMGGAAGAQTDIAASLYGAFSESTTGNNTAQSPSNAAGGLLELRHISNPLIGYEATYSYNRANQAYTSPISSPSGLPLLYGNGQDKVIVPASAHGITGDWLVSLKVTNFRPFALAGGGMLFNVPASGQATTRTTSSIGSISTSTSTDAVFVYGAGLDWTVLPHLGLRFQYRGNLYKAPNLTKLFTSTGAFTHTAEPMIGIFFRL
jgi:opacity protein-like surface antigen